jgi:hypothetical protein
MEQVRAQNLSVEGADPVIYILFEKNVIKIMW